MLQVGISENLHTMKETMVDPPSISAGRRWEERKVPRLDAAAVLLGRAHAWNGGGV